ncbi:hypothetical protein V8J36_18640 [Frigidibacter sp. MR17.14]|uniref:spike base protein, RCAP_Rcc01079 family n=1 Tax=Frigidibacter sp. MR17.14 TaxID=3126509 RepID=UPI0030130B02
MSDPFQSHAPSLQSPASHLMAITPNDSTDLAQVPRALNVAASGTVRMITQGGETADVYVAAGIVFPLRPRRVMATGTTATGIRGLW